VDDQGLLIGAEALLRWFPPGRSPVPPAEFIGLAEETGLINEMMLMLVNQACEAACAWEGGAFVSVNFSPVQLRDPWLAQKIVKLLVETSFPSNRLEIEITETSLFDNLSLAQSIVGSLKNQGIKIALDDFGTGYSSLAHLRALPFDRIKIDKSFVTSLVDNPESAAIVNAIARLGDNLSMPVTAEGIEVGEIEERLRQLGVHKGQGWLYGRPLPITAVLELLAERNLLPAARQSTATPQTAEGLLPDFDEEVRRLA
jgi:EAL domain-containing protein (putative c-di-GMP-specific phosphodiesterase class I)